MADDPEIPIPRPRPAPKRKGGPAVDPDSLQESVACRRLSKNLRVRMASMLDEAALIRADRRRGDGIDSADYERAYDDIVNPIPRPGRLDVVADLSNFIGGGFLGYAINVLTNDRPDYTRFGLAGLAGVFLGGVAVALKNLKHAG